MCEYVCFMKEPVELGGFTHQMIKAHLMLYYCHFLSQVRRNKG